MNRKTFVSAIAFLISLCVLGPAEARGGGSGHSSSHYHSSSGTHSSTSRHHGGTKAAPGVKRDAHGRIARSGKAKDEFKKIHPCPSTGRASGGCPGYVIDHVVPLKRGGQDHPSNMQWQTVQEARIKDKTE